MSSQEEEAPASPGPFKARVSHLNVLPSRQNVILPEAFGPDCLVGCRPTRLHTLERDYSDATGSVFKSPGCTRRPSLRALGVPLVTEDELQLSSEASIVEKSSVGSDQLPAEDDLDTIGVPEVIFNLTNTVVGVGVVSIPYAFRLSGAFCGALLMVLVIAITSFTAKLIGASLTLTSKDAEASEVPKKARDFAFLAHVAFGERGRWLVAVVTAVEVWCALVTFMVMNGVNASLIFPVEKTHAVMVSCILAAALVVLPMWMFSYVSLVSTISLAAAGCAMILCVSKLESWAEPFGNNSQSMLTNLQNIPQAIGIIVFCFAGHPCFPIVHECMRNRADWSFSVDLTFIAALIYYGGLGTLGYVVFGDEIKASFTQNLAKVPDAAMFRQLAALAFLIKAELTAPLLMNATLVSILPPKAEEATWSWRRLAGLCALAGLTTLMAVVFADNVADIASLTGNFCVMITSVLFPTFVYMALKRRSGEQKDASWGTRLVHYSVIVFGIVMAILGTIQSVINLSKSKTSEGSP